jgi:hypothetical protein
MTNKTDSHNKRPSRIWRKAKKKPVKSLRTLKASMWKLFSEYVRRKDADEGGTVSCYTCEKLMFWRDSQAGHAIGGRTNAVLFDASIVRVQCVSCNVFQGGNYPIFTTKLIKEKGMDWWEEKLANARKVVKHTRADLEEMISEYQEKLRALV